MNVCILETGKIRHFVRAGKQGGRMTQLKYRKITVKNLKQLEHFHS